MLREQLLEVIKITKKDLQNTGADRCDGDSWLQLPFEPYPNRLFDEGNVMKTFLEKDDSFNQLLDQSLVAYSAAKQQYDTYQRAYEEKLNDYHHLRDAFGDNANPQRFAEASADVLSLTKSLEAAKEKFVTAINDFVTLDSKHNSFYESYAVRSTSFKNQENVKKMDERMDGFMKYFPVIEQIYEEQEMFEQSNKAANQLGF